MKKPEEMKPQEDTIVVPEEAVVETLSETNEHLPKKEVRKRAPRTKKVAVEADPEAATALTAEIKKIMDEKPTGAESWDTKPALPPQPPATPHQKPWWKKALVGSLFGLSSLFASQKAAATTPEDSLKKSDPIEKTYEQPVQLSQQQMEDWNQFVDFVKESGYQGSSELDVKGAGLGKKLMEQFKKLHPSTTVNYDMVTLVQTEMQKLKETAQGFAKRRNDPNADNIMSGVSKIDGWLGSKTTQFKFPELQVAHYRNDALVSQANLGVVGSDLTTQTPGKKLPKGAKLEKDADGHYYYEDPGTGDMVLYK